MYLDIIFVVIILGLIISLYLLDKRYKKILKVIDNHRKIEQIKAKELLEIEQNKVAVFSEYINKEKESIDEVIWAQSMLLKDEKTKGNLLIKKSLDKLLELEKSITNTRE